MTMKRLTSPGRLALGALLVLVALVGLALAADRKLAAQSAAPGPVSLAGIWGTKYGEMLIRQNGAEIVGTLIKTSNFCPFKNGEVLLEGTILEDSLAGTFKMCQADDDCGPPVRAHAMLLIASEGMLLSGSAHSKEALCPLVGFSRSGEEERGLYFKRLAGKDAADKAVAAAKPTADPKPDADPAKADTPADAPPKDAATANAEPEAAPPIPVSTMPGPPAPPGTYDPRRKAAPTSKTKRLLLEGKQLINTGRFEQARKLFEQVLADDPGDPVALVGIGITYYARNDYAKALEFYKKAIAADPNHGMAYYNAACIYALTGKKDMALRWLKIAAMNGFIPVKQMADDPDLQSLHGNPDFEQLVRGEF